MTTEMEPNNSVAMNMNAVPDLDAGVDYSDLEAKYRVVVNEDYENVIIIDNLPKIDASKEEKLLGVLRKSLFAPAGATPTAEGLFMPRDPETGMSRGYLFVELETAEQAASVFKLAHGYRLDKAHVLYALKFTEFDRLAALGASPKDAEFVPPEPESFVEREFLKSWLEDERARDEFIAVSGNVAAVGRCNRDAAPEPVYSRTNWTDGNVLWSPYGSFLTTFHGQGTALWGGASFARLARFPHPGAQAAFYSPREHFLVTQSVFNPQAPTEPNVLVWEVQGARLVKGFVVEELNSREAVEEAQLQWAFDEAYASRLFTDHVAIYEVPSFALLDRKPMRLEGVRLVSWSPVTHDLVYWVPGTENAPTRVALWNLPTRSVLRTKNLFNVQGILVHWQSEGEFLLLQVDRLAGKGRKTITSNLELFRLRARDIPVEVIECPERVEALQWEPRGSRLLTAHNVEFRNIVRIYDAASGDRGSNVTLVGTLERKQLTHYVWSPRGDFLLLAGLDTTSAFLEFWSVNEMAMLASREHFMATDVAWDPSGRYVSSWVSYWRHQIENGYALWDFKGDLIAKANQPRFTGFSWRPRPPSLLSRERVREIRRNLRAYSERFEAEDAANQAQATTDSSEGKRKALDEWVLYRVRCQQAYDARARLRESVIGRRESQSASATGATKIVQEWQEDAVVETVEEVIADAE
jgi:translation initiation factor 3 subunit B